MIDGFHRAKPMARRKQPRNTLLGIISKAPPLAGIVTGVALYAGIRWGFPALLFKVSSTNALLSKMFPLETIEEIGRYLSWVGLMAAAACWVAAGSSWWSRHKRRRLADMQTGLQSIQALGWQDFERLVAEAYSRRGYRVVESGGGGPDGGIDLLLHREGKTFIVQCKQWRSKNVSVTIAREMWGLVAHHGYAGVKIVSVGNFTPDAEEFAKGKNMELVSGEKLLDLLGLRTHQPAAHSAIRPRPTLVSLSPRCPQCKQPMVKRFNKANGTPFLGCSRYPACRGTRLLPRR